MKTHTSSFKEQIKLIGKEIDSRITFGSTVLGKDDLNAVTPSYQGAILKSVMKQLDIDSNVEIPIGTILRYEFGLKVNGEYEYINYGNYVVYSIEKQEDTNSYKIVCYDKLLYSMLDYVKLPITYPISIRDYINAISTALGLKFANKSGTFANYNKQIQADLYDGLGYTFRDILDELAQVTASTICLNNNDELEIRYITENGDTIDEEFLKDVNVNFGEKFGAVNTIVLSRSGDSDSVYYPSVLPTNPYEIKISDNQIMNGNDRADFLPDIYNKLNGLEFYTNDFVSTGICYYDLCDRYSVKVGDNTYSCVMFNDEVLVTQGLEENIYTELPEQTETDYKHASKDDRMINQVYIIAKKNEAEILAVVNTTNQIQKEINPTKDESGSEIIIEDASNNPLTYLEIEGKSTQVTRNGIQKLREKGLATEHNNTDFWGVNTSTLDSFMTPLENGWVKFKATNSGTSDRIYNFIMNKKAFDLEPNTQYTMILEYRNVVNNNTSGYFNPIADSASVSYFTTVATIPIKSITNGIKKYTLTSKSDLSRTTINSYMYLSAGESCEFECRMSIVKGNYTSIEYIYEEYGVAPSPEFPSEIESVGTYNEETGKYGIEVKTDGKNVYNATFEKTVSLGITRYADTKQLYLDGTPDAETRFMFGGTTLAIGTYTLCLELEKGTMSDIEFFIYKNGSWTTIASSKLSASNDFKNYVEFTLEEETTINIAGYMGTYQTCKNAYINYQVLKGSNVDYNFEPYQQPKSVLMTLNAPLRSLPNGVKDKAYIKNNKLYVDRYIGSVVLNGSEEWLLDGNIDNLYRYKVINSFLVASVKNSGMSNYFKYEANYQGTEPHFYLNTVGSHFFFANISTLEEFKTWLSTHNTQVDYELAEPYTEELGKIEMLKTLKGYNNISTTDKLLPIINLTYVRDTIIADYVENHVTELKLTENEIKASVESVSSSVDGLNTTINRVEEITNDNSQVINVISTNIDRTSGEVREVTTTTGFTFNADGMTIDDGSGFKAEHTANGTYYKDGNSIVGQYTKDGSKQKDLELFGIYSYGKESIDDTPMFIGQLYRDENNEQCFGHFYNGGD